MTEPRTTRQQGPVVKHPGEQGGPEVHADAFTNVLARIVMNAENASQEAIDNHRDQLPDHPVQEGPAEG